MSAARLLHELEEVADALALEGTTARRYADLAGGSDDPAGEVWDHLAHTAELAGRLARLVHGVAAFADHHEGDQ